MWLFNKKKEEEIPGISYLTIPIIDVDVPNSLGNIYTKESIKDLIDGFKEKNGRVYGSCVMQNGIELKSRDLKEITHSVEDLIFEDHTLVAVTKFFNTIQSRKAKEILDKGLGILRPTIRGFVNKETKEIVVLELISFDILPIDDKFVESIKWVSI